MSIVKKTAAAALISGLLPAVAMGEMFTADLCR